MILIGQPRPSFLFIFVLFKHNFFRKNCKHQQESNSDRRIEGEHADHLATTTTAHYGIVFEDKISSAKNFLKFHFNIHFLIWIPSRLSLPSEWSKFLCFSVTFVSVFYIKHFFNFSFLQWRQNKASHVGVITFVNINQFLNKFTLSLRWNSSLHALRRSMSQEVLIVSRRSAYFHLDKSYFFMALACICWVTNDDRFNCGNYKCKNYQFIWALTLFAFLFYSGNSCWFLLWLGIEPRVTPMSRAPTYLKHII